MTARTATTRPSGSSQTETSSVRVLTRSPHCRPRPEPVHATQFAQTTAAPTKRMDARTELRELVGKVHEREQIRPAVGRSCTPKDNSRLRTQQVTARAIHTSTRTRRERTAAVEQRADGGLPRQHDRVIDRHRLAVTTASVAAQSNTRHPHDQCSVLKQAQAHNAAPVVADGGAEGAHVVGRDRLRLGIYKV